jgi:hypothetical protein
MGRNNSDFNDGLHHEPQAEGSDWSPKYSGETLYHGSPHDIIDGVVKPGVDGRTWATNHPEEATKYGRYKDGSTPIHVYEVTPVDHKEVTGVYGPRMYGGNFVKHFHSGVGFKITKKVS